MRSAARIGTQIRHAFHSDRRYGRRVVATDVPLAQGWTEYIDRTDRFSVNFPGQPTIRDTTYPPQRGAPLEARVFTVQDGPRVYSLTVVNPRAGPRTSVAWEAWNFRKRGGEITYDAFAQVDNMDGHQLHITNPDKSLTVVGIYLHARRLVHPGGRCASRHTWRRALSTIAHHPRRGRQADPLRARRRRKPTVPNHQSRRHFVDVWRTTRSVRGIINIRAEKPPRGRLACNRVGLVSRRTPVHAHETNGIRGGAGI